MEHKELKQMMTDAYYKDLSELKNEKVYNKIIESQEFLINPVIFSVSEFKSSHYMDAKDFHLPFSSIKIVLKKPYKLFFPQISKSLEIKWIQILPFLETNMLAENVKDALRFPTKYKFVLMVDSLKDGGNAIAANILESGEIECGIVKSDFKDGKPTWTIGDYDPQKMSMIYSMVYEVLSTIDYINHSEYVVVKKPVKEKFAPTKSYPAGRTVKSIQKTILIKHVNKVTEKDDVKHHLGGKHRYKYRVRGHWHTYAGVKKWLKDYIRGGDGTIFIPKEYELPETI